MANANDWQAVTEDMRDAMADMHEVAVRLNELRAYYVKNAFVSGDYLNGLEGGDQVGTTGRTKTQVISFVTFAAQLGDFLDSVALSADDRRSIMEQFRATA